MFQKIDADLTSKILNPTTDADVVETALLMRQVFTLGELAQICPNRVNKRLFLLMQSIIFQTVKRKKKDLVVKCWTSEVTLRFKSHFYPLEDHRPVKLVASQTLT